MGRTLRHGFTTGACAAAAAAGAARMLREQRTVEELEIALPAGFSASFALHGQRFDKQRASCYVIKDAGDDPDVTHGVEVHAEVSLVDSPSPTRGEGEKTSPPPFMGGGRGEGKAHIIIEGGRGIGKITKPGLAVPVGEWAINPVPRQMITEAVREVFPGSDQALHVAISIPDGEERAKRTLNARLGIVGGLSILGTTGVVRPVSHKAWTDTLEVALDVALANGCDAVVLSTGRTSEMAAQEFLQKTPPPLMGGDGGEGGPQDGTPSLTLPYQGGGDSVRLPEEAFIMMGDHVGYALEACHRKGVSRVLLAVQFAKLFKIACGHPQTHVGSSRLDLERLAEWARIDGLDGALSEEIECANTARQVYESLGAGHPLVGIVAGRALARMRQWAPGAAVAVLLVGYDGSVQRFGDFTKDNPLP